MFRPYDSAPSNPPSRPEGFMSADQRMEMSTTPAPKLYAPLPSDWDQLDLDQRVRSIGEW